MALLWILLGIVQTIGVRALVANPPVHIFTGFTLYKYRLFSHNDFEQPIHERTASQFTLRCAGEVASGSLLSSSFYEGSQICTNRPSSQHVLLSWKSPPKRILLLSKLDCTLIEQVAQASVHLHNLGVEIFMEQSMLEYMASTKCGELAACVPFKELGATQGGVDLVITFGGDGLLLHFNSLFGGRCLPPVMCFDFGSLGFLTPFVFDNFAKDVEAVLNEEIMLTLRMRLDCTIYRNNTRGDTYRVLNEAVVDRGPSPYLGVLDLACDNQYITTLQGDGLIFATPTGSTAYSLAAGGSVIYPSVPAILVTPICAHSLSFRPMVLPDSAVLTCSVPTECRSSGWVSFDGKFRQELHRGDKLEIRMSHHPMPTINRKSFTADWLDSLREGFMYNLRPRQLPSL